MNSTTPADPKPRRPCTLLATVMVAVLPPLAASAGALPERERQPVALAFSRDGDRLFVANGKSGSLTVIDPSAGAAVSEHDVGRGLSDLAVLPDGRHLLAPDRSAGELLLVAWQDRSARVVARHEL